MFNKKKGNKRQKPTSNMPIDTVIAEGITFKGDIFGDGAIRIDGKVEGNIELNKGIIIGENAETQGKLQADNIIVYGSHNGDLECKELYIMESGQINGNMLVNRFSVEMGGKYTGNLKMSDNEINFQEKLQEAKESKKAK